MSALYLSSRFTSCVVHHHGQHASCHHRVAQCDLNAPLTLMLLVPIPWAGRVWAELVKVPAAQRLE
jgi:hypothetical protein